MTRRVLGYSGSASGLNGSFSVTFSRESLECFEAISASDPVGSCSGIVSGFAGVAESTGFPGLTSEINSPILANPRCIYEELTVDSGESNGRYQLGGGMKLTGRLEGILRVQGGDGRLYYISKGKGNDSWLDFNRERTRKEGA